MIGLRRRRPKASQGWRSRVGCGTSAVDDKASVLEAEGANKTAEGRLRSFASTGLARDFSLWEVRRGMSGVCRQLPLAAMSSQSVVKPQ
jgi:hypothetical protein